ncbi:MAG: response regulator [Verrucomicrobia bacterium]|nr:response regulator [Verrucomicrobiota bacterium]
MRILIADDDDVARRVLQTALEKLGHDVVMVENGAQAWEIFVAKPPQTIVSDWMMPELDGIEFCRKVRAKPRAEYTYFILLTIRSNKEDYQNAMAAGVDDFLTKPLDRDELAMRLHVAERILGFTTQIRQLKSILPICMYCKRVRDDKDYWRQIESYIHENTGTDFSHGVCPQCYEKHVKPDLEAFATQRRGIPPAK